MPKVQIQNQKATKVTVPPPVARTLNPKGNVIVSLSYADLQSDAIVAGVRGGLWSVTVLGEDASLPDELESPVYEPITSVVRLEDDFLCDAFPGQSNWVAAGISGGAASAVTSSPALVGACGVLGLAVATNGAAVLFRQGTAAVPLGFGAMTADFKVRPSVSLPTGGENYTVRFGFGNQNTAAGASTAGVAVVLDTSLSASNWVIERIFAGQTQRVVTTVPVTVAWRRFSLNIDTAGTSCELLVDGTSVLSLDLSDVTKDEQNLRFGPFFQMIKTAGNSSRNFFIDYVSMKKWISR